MWFLNKQTIPSSISDGHICYVDIFWVFNEQNEIDYEGINNTTFIKRETRDFQICYWPKGKLKPTVPLHTIVAPKLKFAILSEM